jgi:asparagine synthase (glutamine-hydrolysing)
MCGICGIINFNQKSVPEIHLRSMMNQIKHRGPDDEGIFLDGNVGLGFVRLSIIDLSPAGHQPMFSADKRYVIVFNGEIYNYIELRQVLQHKGYHFISNSDTEVLIYAYVEWGEDCLDHFNGMFSFVIYDQVDRKVFAARDRFGVKPFYYYLDQDMFVFASEIPALFHAGNINKLPNDNIIYTYLTYNRTDFDEQTFFKNVVKLVHGHKLSLSTNRSDIRISRWYTLSEKLINPFNNTDEYKELLTDSVGLRLRSDVPVSLSFSGGIDSSTILSILLKKFERNDIHSFSAIYGKGKRGDESEFIDIYKSENFPLHFTHPTGESLLTDLSFFVESQNEPVQSTSIYAQYKVCQLIHQNGIKVSLTGQGADEQLGGYHYFFGQYFKELLSHFHLLTLLSESAYYLKNHKSLFAFKYLLFYALSPDIQNRLAENKAKFLNKDFSNSQSGTNYGMMDLYSAKNLRDSFLNHFEYKLEHLLKWDDINAMRFSVETRVPFLDYRLVERTLALNSKNIIKHGTTKYYLREAMQGILPEEIRTRHSKIGFSTPEGEWFRNKEFANLIKEILYSPQFNNRGYIDPDRAKSLFSQHSDFDINISREIWKWINLELWFRKYMDNE